MPHKPAIERAHSAVEKGHVDSGTWDAPDQDERDQADCLGSGKKYPVMKGGKVSRHAVANAESRATTNGHPEIARHAKELLQKINAHKDDPMAASAADVTGLIFPDHGGEFVAALTLGTDLPKERNGIPVFHYWKEELRPGDLSDANGRKWSIRPNDIDDAVSDGKRALAMGWEPPIQDHHYAPKKSYGKIVGYRKNDRGGLEWLHQFLGEQNRIEGLAKPVSPMLIPNFTDAKKNQWRWFPDHSASVFRPQQKDLQDFTPALAASGQTVNAVTLLAESKESTMDLKIIRDAFGLSADKPDNEVLTLAAESPAKIESLTSELADQKEANSALAISEGKLKLALSAAQSERDKALALSADEQPEPENPRIVAMANKLAIGNISLALGAGHITQDQAEYLETIRKDRPALALSGNIESGDSMIDTLIAFAAMGAAPKRQSNGVLPNVPLKRGNPVSAIPKPKQTALALSGEDEPSVPKGGSAEVRAMYGLPAVTQ